jgi:four helix bundle protein
MYKFEKLEIYQLALVYTDMMYSLAERLPEREERNLQSQTTRAATSIVLNIAEGSTSQSDTEQRRFLSMSIRSLMETVACQHLIGRRKYVNQKDLSTSYEFSQTLYAKLQAMRRALKNGNRRRTTDRLKNDNRPMTADRLKSDDE